MLLFQWRFLLKAILNAEGGAFFVELSLFWVSWLNKSMPWMNSHYQGLAHFPNSFPQQMQPQSAGGRPVCSVCVAWMDEHVTLSLLSSPLSRWTASRGSGARLPCMEAAAGTTWSPPGLPGWTAAPGRLRSSRWPAGCCTATSPWSPSAFTSPCCLRRGTMWPMAYP